MNLLIKKLKKGIEIISVFFLLVAIHVSAYSCGCGGPINPLQTDIDSSKAIFIGIVSQINTEDSFHLNNQFGTGLKYVNFNIIATHKGIFPSQQRISIFDFMSGTSCEGLIYGKEIGDTTLVFANDITGNMLGSFLCGRHPTFSKLTLEEREFIDTANWVNPLEVNTNSRYIIQHQPNNKHSKNTPDKWILILILILAMSIIINIILFSKRIRVTDKLRLKKIKNKGKSR